MGNSYSRILLLGKPEKQDPQPRISGPKFPLSQDASHYDEVLAENVFHSMLSLERRREERSHKPFVLMLLDANVENAFTDVILRQAVEIAVLSKRETDLVGWYRFGAILGIIFTEVTLEGDLPITQSLRTKMETAFLKHLGRERASRIAISTHIFPESFDKNATGWAADSKLYPDLKRKESRKRMPVSSTA
jgi:hypothetical protein